MLFLALAGLLNTEVLAALGYVFKRNTMFADSGSQEHIYGSGHIQTEFVENLLCLIFDILIEIGCIE